MAPKIDKIINPDGGVPTKDEKKTIKAVSQIASMLIAGAAGSDVDVAFDTATNEVTNNYLNHAQQRDFAKALEACQKNPACDEATIIIEYQKKSADNLAEEVRACSQGLSTSEECKVQVRRHAAANLAFADVRSEVEMSSLTREILTKFHIDGVQENAVIAQIQIGKSVKAALAGSDLSPEAVSALAISIAGSISGVVGRRGKGEGGKPNVQLFLRGERLGARQLLMVVLFIKVIAPSSPIVLILRDVQTLSE